MKLSLQLLTLQTWREEADRKRKLERRRRAAEENDEELEDAYQELRKRLVLLLFLNLSKARKWKSYMTMEGVWRRDRRIPRIALVDPAASPWSRLYESRNDQALITVTGFDHASFHSLLFFFEPFFHGYTPWVGAGDGTQFRRLKKTEKRGRRRLLDSRMCLGLVLAWYRFKGAEFILCGWFGFTGGHANTWLRFGRRMLLLSLWKHPLAVVALPTAEKIKILQQQVRDRLDALPNVYCVADGCKMALESCDGLTKQSMYYNGWKSGHYVSNLFVFSMDGRIIMSVVNAPGSVHDSTLADWGDVYEKLRTIYDQTGGVCVADSAFSTVNAPYLIKSSGDITAAKSPQDVRVIRQATSVRQAAEWGMKAVQSAFPRVKDKIHCEEGGERKIYLMLLVLLCNMPLELVGLNQIRNVFVPGWSRDSAYFVESDW